VLGAEVLIELVVSDADSATRVDRLLLGLLRERFPNLSRNALKDAFTSRNVLLGARTLHPSDTLRPGTHALRVLGLQAEAPRATASSEPFLDVVYRDEDLLILNKASGIPSVPLDSSESRTACGAALALHPELAGLGRGGLEPAILHRLDTGTSGLIAFARTAPAFDQLITLWKNREVQKTYRALTRVLPPEREALRGKLLSELPLRIDTPIAHDPKSSRRMMVVQPGRQHRGEPLEAITHLVAAHECAPGLWDLEIRIDTGVMHQIRCHLASIGLPLLGDSIYGGVSSRRLWLHARELRFAASASTPALALVAALPEGWPISDGSDRTAR